MYQELSFQDNDALGEMDEGADISGILSLENIIMTLFFVFFCVSVVCLKIFGMFHDLISGKKVQFQN